MLDQTVIPPTKGDIGSNPARHHIFYIAQTDRQIHCFFKIWVSTENNVSSTKNSYA